MALKTGDVYVAVTASIGPAIVNLGKLVKAVQDTAKQVKEATKDLGEIGAVVAAGIGAAVAAAAKSNPALQAQVTRLTDLLYTLAADLGDLFMPVVKKLTDFVSRLVATFQRLSPEVKEAGARVASWTAGAGLAIGAVGKLAGVVEVLAGSVGKLVGALGKLSSSTSLAKLGAQVAAMALPVVAVAAAVAGLALLGGALYGAWTDTSSGLKDAVKDILGSITQMASKLWDMLKGLFDGLVSLVEGMAIKSLNFIAWLIREAAKKLAPVAKAARMHDTHRALLGVQFITGEALLEMVKEAGGKVAAEIDAKRKVLERSVGEGLAKAGELAADAKEAVTYGFGKSLEGLEKALRDSGISDLMTYLNTLIKAPKLSDAEPTVRYADGIDKMEEYIEKVIAALNARVAEEARLEYERSVAAEEWRLGLQLEAERLAAAAAKAMRDARETLVSGLTSAFGRIKELVDYFKMGTQASGSAWGGLAAAIAKLLTESKGFADLVTMVLNIVQRVADGLGKLLTPLEPVIGALGYIADVLMTALEPLLNYVGQALSYLAPPLVIVGKLLEGLAPLLNVLMMPLSLLQDAAKGLFLVLKFVSIVLLMVVKLISDVWNAVIKAVQWVLRQLGKVLEWFGTKALTNLADKLEGMKVNTDAMGESMRNLQNTTWDSANAQARQTAEVLKGTAALEKMNEALTNVPSAWRIALRRYQLQDTADGPGTPPLPGVGASGVDSESPGAGMPQWYLDYMELPEALRERIERRSPEPYIGRDRPSGDEYGIRSRTIGQQKGATYNLTVQTVDEAAGIDKAVRFVRRVEYLEKMADSGRRISKSSRWAEV
ncbi:hypothetical protein VZQ01_06850 [Myxococcus faecalis]|uniref:hypothetical protein n=1 Tax=Myxococcus faecalis TaxID=3115646 RepID=UPI003CF4E46A